MVDEGETAARYELLDPVGSEELACFQFDHGIAVSGWGAWGESREDPPHALFFGPPDPDIEPIQRRGG